MDQPNQNFLPQNEPAQIKQPNTVWAIIITAVVVALLVGAGMYLLQAQKVKTLENQLNDIGQKLTLLAAKSVISTPTTQNNITISSSTTNVATSTTTTTGTKLYQDNINKVSFYYPKNKYDLTATNNNSNMISFVNMVLKSNSNYPDVISFRIQKMVDGQNNTLTKKQWSDIYMKYDTYHITSSNNLKTIKTSATINGKEFTKIEYDQPTHYDSIEYYYFKDGIVYLFILDYGVENNSQDTIDDLQTILKTFTL